MDNIDIKIIECLRANARENASGIGAKVNMSVSAVIERIKKLEANGIIRSYTLSLDHEKLGLTLGAFVRVRLSNSKYSQSFGDYMKRHPLVIECHCTTGSYDFLLKVAAADSASLGVLIDDIKSLAGVCAVDSEVILSTVKENLSADIFLKEDK